MPQPNDVVVLGAGAAGLAAAAMLVQNGARVAILEARSRCGGRIHTVRDTAAVLPIELGAEFVHGHAPEVFTIAAAAQLRVVELPDRHWQLGAGRPRDMASFWPQLDAALARLGRGRDQPLATRLAGSAMPAARRRLLAGFVAGYHGADLQRVSCRWLAAGAGDTDHRQYRLVDGYDRVIDWLRDRVPAADLHLRTAAVQIDWRRGHVTVQARTAAASPRLRSFRGRALLCTLPCGVLQAPAGAPGAVRFAPDLPHKRRALLGLAPGQVSKTTLSFRDRFWADAAASPLAALNFGHAFDRPVPTLWTELPLLTPTLVAWAGGTAALELLALAPPARLQLLLREIGRMLHRPEPFLLRQLVAWHHHDWRADPCSRGAYAYVTAGAMRAPAALAQPVDDTLFFAGEATDAEQMGTVAGALRSGHRAAGEVLAALRA